MGHKEWIGQMTAVLQGTWVSQKDGIRNKVEEKLKALDNLLENIRGQNNQETRELLIIKCKEAQDNLDIAISNLMGIEQATGIIVTFLGSLKKQMTVIEQSLAKVAEDVEEIKKDVKFLVGKTIPELIEFKCKKVMDQK